MGWNDRIENNPYEPYPDYNEQDHYEAWVNYQRMCAEETANISSQNVDPAELRAAMQEAPPLLSLLFRRFFQSHPADPPADPADSVPF